jgi:enoyl-CoA hydratase
MTKEESTTPTQVTLQTDGPVARVWFETPNGVHILGRDTRRQLDAVLDRLEADEGSRVVVFASQGRTFCAGADLHELASLDENTAETIAQQGQALMSRIERLRQITIAAIHAACAGGGCELSLACDFRWGSSACRIGLPETSIGILPGWGGTVRTRRLLGPSAAKRIVLTAELWPAATALSLGLLHAVFPAESFRDDVEAEVEKLLTRGPSGLSLSKQLIESCENGDLETQLQQEARAFAACYAIGQPQEGIAAFLEKREPQW